jgi:hypothetical protein
MVGYINAVDFTNVKKIGSSAFAKSTKLTTAVFDDNKLETIGASAFSGCTALCSSALWNMSDDRIGESGETDTSKGEFVISSKCSSIGNSAFSGTAIKTLDLGNGVETIGDSAFANNKSLVSITIGANAKSIGTYAFSGCTNLEQAILGDNISSIGKYAFSNCSNLAEIVLPQELVNVQENTFQNCTNLSRVVFNPKLENIKSNAFLNCTGLKALTFNHNLFLEQNAFKGCKNIKTLTIPNTVNIVSTREPLPDSTDCVIRCTGTSQATEYANAHGYSIVPVEFVDGLNYVVVKVYVTIPDGLKVTKSDGTVLKTGDYVVVDDNLSITAAEKEDYNAEISVNDVTLANGTTADYVVDEADTELVFGLKYEASGVYGDSNGDKSITAADSSAVMQYVLDNGYDVPIKAKGNANWFKLIDVDGNGEVTAADAAIIMQKALDREYKMPVEKK